MPRNNSIIIGSCLAVLAAALFVWLVISGKSNLVPEVRSDVMEIGELKETLSNIGKKEKHGDLPVDLKSEDIDKENPFNN